MKQVINQLAKTARRNELFWRYGFNLGSTVSYKIRNNKYQQEKTHNIVADLNANGFARTTLNDLFSGEGLSEQFDHRTSELLAEWQEKLTAIKADVDDESLVGQKTYSVELLGSKVVFDATSIFAQFALNETILSIANAYLGMYAKLRYYNIWYTFPTKGSARESQLWHYDREDNYILKVFLYLRDVDDGAGPFTYAPKTHRKGSEWSKQPRFSLEGNVPRSTDEQMAEVVPESSWIRGNGVKGTIIFADTRGYHKGGEAKMSDRLMYTCMFTSPASESKRLISYPDQAVLTHLSKQQKLALQLT